MNPETNNDTEQDHFTVNTGDVLFVNRNLKDEMGEYIRDENGKVQTELEDGWEVIELNALDPRTSREAVLLQNTKNPNEMKFYSEEQLKVLQDRAERSITERAAQAAASMLGEIDGKSQELANQEPISREEAEKIGEEAVEAVDREESNQSRGAAESLGSIADIMSGKHPSMKFDIGAAQERYQREKESRLISESDLSAAESVMQGVTRRFGIVMAHQDPRETVSERHNIEGSLVQESFAALDRMKRGSDPLAVSLEEGFLLASTRTSEAFAAIAQRLLSAESGLFDEKDLEAIRPVFDQIHAMARQQGPEGSHFAVAAFDIEQYANGLLNKNNHQPTRAYTALIGALAGMAGRIGPDAQHQAYSRLSGAIEHVGRFKKPESE